MRRKTFKQCGMISEFDSHIYKGIKSKTDDLKHDTLVTSALKKALGIPVNVTLETGEKVNVTICELLVSNVLKEAIENPSVGKLKDIAAITGELKDSVDVNLQSPEKLFGDIIISNDK